MTPDHAEFKSAVKLKDKIHVVALAIDGSMVGSMSSRSQEKLLTIKKYAIQRGELKD